MREAWGTAAVAGKSEGGSGYGCSFRALGAGHGAEVGNGQLVWGQAGRTTPAGAEGHGVWKLALVVSCGGSSERGWRTELELGSGKSFDDQHRPTTLGAAPKRAGWMSSGGFWFGLG